MKIYKCQSCKEPLDPKLCKVNRKYCPPCAKKKIAERRKERYHSDPDFKKRVMEASNRYNHTRSGKKALKRSHAKRAAKFPQYHSEYMKKRRLQAKKDGICYRCLKNRSVKGKTNCASCRKCLNESSSRFRQRRKYEKKTN